MKRIWVAEFIGTFFVIFLGCGSLIGAELGYLKESYAPFVFGGTVLAMIATFGHISYAHFNPAVSVGFFVLKRISFKQLLIYWSAEFSGALLASVFHFLLFGSDHSFGMTIPQVSWTSSFILEVVGTCMLMSVITVVATDERVHKGLPAVGIGSTVMIISIVIGPLSGGSFNPARTLGPAVLAMRYDGIVLYFISAIIGSIAGALISRFVVNGPTHSSSSSRS